MLLDKVILVTGASSGIGLATALAAQDKGASVIFASRNIENNDKFISLLKNNSFVKNVDVGNETSVRSLFETINNRFSKLDAIINCAGYVNPENLLSTSFENWQNTITTNLTGTFLISKHAVFMMKNAGGVIINISSTAGLTPRPGWSAYAASKSGVIGFSTAIAEELSEYHIKVFIICPGRTATPLRKILAPNENPSTIMQPETVSKTILFCLTDEAAPLEGQSIIVRERF